MIIKYTQRYNEITQKIYDSEVESINRDMLKCSSCKQCGFYINSYYYKSIKHRKYEAKTQILITQLICPNCGKTHSVLLSQMIPWSQLSVHDVVDIINLNSSKQIRQFLSDFHLVCIEEIYRIKRKFKSFWKERLASSNIELDCNLTKACISAFGLQFIQIRRTACMTFP